MEEELNGYPVLTSLSDALRFAAGNGRLAAVHELLSEGAPSDGDKEGRTALHHAAIGGHLDVVDLLLRRGFPTEDKDKLGRTALICAASRGQTEVVQLLLRARCRIDRRNNEGNTAIQEAAANGFSQTVQILVMHFADVHILNKAGGTALHLSAQNGHNQSARILLFAGCNPNVKNLYGDTALHTAARYGHAGVTKILVSGRCKINLQNKNGDTALHIATAMRKRKIARVLIEAGINCRIKNKAGERAEDVANKKQYTDMLEIIKNKAVSKKRPDAKNATCPAGDTDSISPEKKKSRFFLFFHRKKKIKTSDIEIRSTSEAVPAAMQCYDVVTPRLGSDLHRSDATRIQPADQPTKPAKDQREEEEKQHVLECSEKISEIPESRIEVTSESEQMPRKNIKSSERKHSPTPQIYLSEFPLGSNTSTSAVNIYETLYHPFKLEPLDCGIYTEDFFVDTRYEKTNRVDGEFQYIDQLDVTGSIYRSHSDDTLSVSSHQRERKFWREMDKHKHIPNDTSRRKTGGTKKEEQDFGGGREVLSPSLDSIDDGEACVDGNSNGMSKAARFCKGQFGVVAENEGRPSESHLLVDKKSCGRGRASGKIQETVQPLAVYNRSVEFDDQTNFITRV